MLKKAVHRCVRILLGKKGVYCTFGKGNIFCRNLFLHEMTMIGKYNYIGPGTMMLNVKIGNYCSIGPDVKIGQMNHDLGYVSTSTFTLDSRHMDNGEYGFTAPTIIGNDVWIGANAVIKQGVEIGNGAVVGAGAIVTKNIPAYAVVGGVPARIIKYRFDENKIALLEKSEWWELPKEKVVEKCRELQKELSELNI